MPTSESDHSAITDLAARFSDAVNRRDTEAFHAVWTEDGVWDVTNMALAEDRESAVTLLGNLLSQWELFVQMTHVGTIQLDGDRATARWPMHEVGRNLDGEGFLGFGIYSDDLRRTDDGWRFTRRKWHWLYQEQPQLPGQVFPLAIDRNAK